MRFRYLPDGRFVVAGIESQTGYLSGLLLHKFPLSQVLALAQVPGAAELRERAAAAESREKEQRANWGSPTPLIPPARARLKLKVPPGNTRKSDRFYADFVAAWHAASQRTPGPAVLLAEENGVPVTTVHGWAKEARRRGLLPPGERGRARSNR